MKIKLDCSITGALLPLSTYCAKCNRQLKLIVELHNRIEWILRVKRPPSRELHFVVMGIKVDKIAKMLNFVLQ